MSEEELLEYLRKPFIVIGNYKIEYKGEDVDTINGRTETWLITRNLPLFEEGDKEIEEIPQFKCTLEQLDNLTILGDKE